MFVCVCVCVCIYIRVRVRACARARHKNKVYLPPLGFPSLPFRGADGDTEEQEGGPRQEMAGPRPPPPPEPHCQPPGTAGGREALV